MTLVGLSVLAAFVSGCSGGKSGFGSPGSATVSTASTSAPAGSGEAEFQTTLYTFVNNQGCVKCHASIVHPQFAAPDLDTAYAAATGTQIGNSTPLVDFSNPDASIFIVYAGNGHCNDTPCSDPSDRPAIQAAIEAWAAAEVAAGNKGAAAALPTYMTKTIALPAVASLPAATAASPALIRFPLSSLTPSVASLGSAILEVQLEMINPTEYRISNPRIEGNTASVNITGIHVFINAGTASGVGSEDVSQGNIWDTLVVTAMTVALPSPLSATTAFTATPLSTTPIEAQSQSASDTMTIGFDNLQ